MADFTELRLREDCPKLWLCILIKLINMALEVFSMGAISVLLFSESSWCLGLNLDALYGNLGRKRMQSFTKRQSSGGVTVKVIS